MAENTEETSENKVPGEKTPNEVLKEFLPDFVAACKKHNVKAAFVAMNPLPPEPGVEGQKFQIAVNGDEDVVNYFMSIQQQLQMAANEIRRLQGGLQRPPMNFHPKGPH
jgi:hypothetical protein